jgi:hypothetical protein
MGKNQGTDILEALEMVNVETHLGTMDPLYCSQVMQLTLAADHKVGNLLAKELSGTHCNIQQMASRAQVPPTCNFGGATCLTLRNSVSFGYLGGSAGFGLNPDRIPQRNYPREEEEVKKDEKQQDFPPGENGKKHGPHRSRA